MKMDLNYDWRAGWLRQWGNQSLLHRPQSDPAFFAPEAISYIYRLCKNRGCAFHLHDLANAPTSKD